MTGRGRRVSLPASLRASQGGDGVQVLETQAVSVRFQGMSALDSVDISLAEQDILGLLGPNGAGKTTLVNVMSGFQRPTQGRLLLDGKS